MQSESERHFLKSTYNIAEKRIMVVSQSSFERDLETMLAGRRMDIVLAFNDSDDLLDTWSHLADGGKLIHTMKRPIPEVRLLDTSKFSKGATLASFDIDSMVCADPVYSGK